MSPLFFPSKSSFPHTPGPVPGSFADAPQLPTFKKAQVCFGFVHPLCHFFFFSPTEGLFDSHSPGTPPPFSLVLAHSSWEVHSSPCRISTHSYQVPCGQVIGFVWFASPSSLHSRRQRFCLPVGSPRSQESVPPLPHTPFPTKCVPSTKV